MAIVPLPQFEADLKAHLAEEDRKAYEALRAPKTLVVRFGSMKMIGEFQYQGTVKPGCGSKVVVRTFRGTELGEMLTSTCPNSGCSKSVSRQEMLQYIDNSGGHDYPFFTEGRVLRIATPEDLDQQSRIEQGKHELKVEARRVAQRLGLNVKIVEVEPVLGGESVTCFYASEERMELRDLARELGQLLRTRVELRGVGARDEARLAADYEKCGQYCCCKNFLKVLKPVSMKSAKVQKATLDPLKISGRCGRLMCCLRYEDQTYDELSKRLPRRKSRVGTPEGDGTVLDGQILTQLVLVELDALGDDGKIRQIAVAVEDLTAPQSATPPAQRPVAPPSASRERRDERRDERRGGGTPPPSPASPASPASPPPPSSPAQSETARAPEERPREQRPRSDRPRDDRAAGGTARPPERRPSQPPPPRAPGPGSSSPGSSSRSDEIDDLLGGDLLDDDPLRGGGGPRGGDRGGDRGGGGRPRRRR